MKVLVSDLLNFIGFVGMMIGVVAFVILAAIIYPFVWMNNVKFY